MQYIVEKFIYSGFNYHPQNTIETWVKRGSSSWLEDAKNLAVELADNVESGRYRVRDFYSGKVYFEITTKHLK